MTDNDKTTILIAFIVLGTLLLWGLGFVFYFFIESYSVDLVDWVFSQ